MKNTIYKEFFKSYEHELKDKNFRPSVEYNIINNIYTSKRVL